MKICIVSSVGGHLTEILSLKDTYKNFEHFYVLNKKITPPKELKADCLFIKHSERDYKLIINFNLFVFNYFSFKIYILFQTFC